MSKRDELIDAAARVLSARGVRAASIKEIAAEAQVAPGLLHYYFASKEELVLAILRRIRERDQQRLDALARSLGPAELASGALAQARSRLDEDPGWYRMRFDLFALALREPAFAGAVASLLRESRSQIAAVARAVHGERGADADALGAILQACFDGLALQKLIDPDFDLDRAYRALADLVAPPSGPEA